VKALFTVLAITPLAAILASSASCAQIAGVGDVTFVVEAGAEGGDATPPQDTAIPDVSPDEGTESSVDLPVEDCPVCGGGPCCSPRHCKGQSCCADRAGPCSKDSDCCDGQCDVAAGRCTGPCLHEGKGPCVVDGDCCQGTCNSEGKCDACGGVGKACTSDGECCFGLSCTSTTNGTCMSL